MYDRLKFYNCTTNISKKTSKNKIENSGNKSFKQEET